MLRSSRILAVLAAASFHLAALAGVSACGDSTDAAGPSATNDAATVDTTAAGDTGGGGDAGSSSPDAKPATNDGATTGDASTAQEKLICDALASRAACPGGALACTADVKCIYGKVMSYEAAVAYATCRSAPSCKGDDTCGAEAGKAVGGAAADAYTTECLARRTACNGSFNDDYCVPTVFAFPGAAAGAQACLSEACAQIPTCMNNLQAIKDIAACKQ